MRQPHGQSRQQEYGEDAGDRRDEAPAEGRSRAEDLHSQADEPLAQLRVDDVSGLAGQR